MPEQKEPRIHSSGDMIPHGSNLLLKLSGEQYKGLPVLDTKVEIEAGTLCWITWNDRQAFLSELKAVIDKYAI